MPGSFVILRSEATRSLLPPPGGQILRCAQDDRLARLPGTRMRGMATVAPTELHPSVCPLDCPDACSLEVRVEEGASSRSEAAASTRSRRGTSARRCGATRSTSTETAACGTRESATGRKGRGPVPPGELGRGARSHRRQAAGTSRPGGRRSDPAALLRRLERIPLAGHDGRPSLLPPRRFAAGAHGLRRARRARGVRALRQDGRGSRCRTTRTRV